MALTVAALCSAPPKKNKKAPDAVVESIRLLREGDSITIDGRVKNTGEKPIEGMVLIFEFFGPNKDSLTIQNGPVEAALMEPAEEAEFLLQVKAPARAVSVKVEAQDKSGKDLRIEKNGPFAIE